MSFPSYTNKTDNVDEIQAADINILYTDLAAIARAAALITDLVVSSRSNFIRNCKWKQPGGCGKYDPMEYSVLLGGYSFQ